MEPSASFWRSFNNRYRYQHEYKIWLSRNDHKGPRPRENIVSEQILFPIDKKCLGNILLPQRMVPRYGGPWLLRVHMMGDLNRNAFICNKDVIELYESAHFCCGHFDSVRMFALKREKICIRANCGPPDRNLSRFLQYEATRSISSPISSAYFGLASSLVLHGFTSVWDWPSNLIGK